MPPMRVFATFVETFIIKIAEAKCVKHYYEKLKEFC